MDRPFNFDGQRNAHVDRAALITEKAITVVIGGGEEEPARSFTVHRDLACTFSPFFAAACRGPWRESRQGAVELPEQDPKIFELYMRWLYTNELMEGRNYDEYADSAVDSLNDSYVRLMRAYFLGDMLLDRAFKNAIIDAVIDRVCQTERYPCALAKLVYDNTSGAESRLRRLLVDFYAYAHDLSWFVGDNTALDMDDAPREFFRDVLVKISDIKENLDGECWPTGQWVSDRCRRYHEHPEGVVFPNDMQSEQEVYGNQCSNRMSQPIE